jgi:hypothetical protein
LNLRPSGYEPDELPGCSTPRRYVWVRAPACAGTPFDPRLTLCAGSYGGGWAPSRARGRHSTSRARGRHSTSRARGRHSTSRAWGRHSTSRASRGVSGRFGEPGGDLLFRVLARSTIGAEGFHGRVRDGIGCFAPRCGHQADQTSVKPRAHQRTARKPRAHQRTARLNGARGLDPGAHYRQQMAAVFACHRVPAVAGMTINDVAARLPCGPGLPPRGVGPGRCGGGFVTSGERRVADRGAGRA